ncbi:MAG: UDP-galactose-4-epimerase [Bacteroides sp. SM23_62]|nr:MAG: UDP-galactose-4-epimerase [Bacteroides sp. SM23_62]
MKKLVVVTGGTGFIGSHTAVELMEAGYDVLIIDDLSNSRIEVLDGIERITGRKPLFEKFDLCDRVKVTECFKKYTGIAAIIHFAAHKAVPESMDKPLMYYENNLLSLINLLRAMKEYGVKYFVFSSSCTVYGQPDTLPVTEKSPIKKAASPYGNTKQISEEIIQDVVSAGDPIQAISLRYFNPIGAHPTAYIGELPIGIPLNLVPYLTQTAIGIREELQVFGDDYNTPDGSAIRDYINVVDLSRAHVVSIDRLLAGKNKSALEIFNLGTGNGLSVFEIINSFEKATGIKVKYQVVGRREGDIEKVWADTSLANNELGWKAVIPLEETLRSAWKWEQYIRQENNG